MTARSLAAGLTAGGVLSRDELRRMVEAAVVVDFLPQDGGMNRLLPHLDQVYGALHSRAALADHLKAEDNK